MSLTLIGRKKGMTQVFDAKGRLVVCTVIHAEPNTVLMVKQEEKDGYNSVQTGAISYGSTKQPRVTKALKGHFAKAGSDPCRVVRESRVDTFDSYSVGQKIDTSIFSDGMYVDIEGVSKGKGYQGVMKLHNMSGGPAAHGSGFHRHMGSTGMRSTPGRCFPGGKRASRMGGDKVTVQNLRIVAIKGDVLLIEGAVPGARSGIVYIRKSKKLGNKVKKD